MQHVESEAERIVRMLAESVGLKDVYALRVTARRYFEDRAFTANVTAGRDAEIEAKVARAYWGVAEYAGAQYENRFAPFPIQAIKVRRELTGCGLREAKDWCDARRNNWKDPR